MMSKAQSAAAKRRHQRDNHHRCVLCLGRGLQAVPSVHTRAVSGGRASYRKSLERGQVTMKERSQNGGRPRELTLAEMDVRRASQTGGL